MYSVTLYNCHVILLLDLLGILINFATQQGLKSELEKASPILGRTAIYLKESRISELPK